MIMCTQYQGAAVPFVKSEIWSEHDENDGDWSKNFFRWVVDEASTHLAYDEALFPNMDYFELDRGLSYASCILDHAESKFDSYERSVPAVNDSKQIHSDCEESQDYETITHRGPGRPRIISSKKLPNRKTGKLWEFLRNLLLDERTCPSLIKWDNFSEGTFKFVQSEKVAQLWGNRKNNTKMNYEKLSRAMRYYYRSQVLLPVAGKRLVYKFGPHATGWRTPNPIL